MAETALCDPEVTRVTATSPFANVAIQTASGPHVTPVLFSSGAGRVWFAVSRSTLKARVLAKRPRAALLLRDGDDAVLVRGDVHLLDPLRPATWTSAPRELASAPFGMQAYALRNPQELFGFALDTLGLRGAPLAGGLLLAALDPAEITTSPAWRGVTAPSRATAPPIPRGLPRAVSSLPRAGGDAVLGWITPGGPVALPAHWDAASGVATVSRALAEDVGVSGSGPACVAFDAVDRKRPTGKRGVMLRGAGSARSRGDATAVALDADRATWWIGFETGTVQRGSSLE